MPKYLLIMLFTLFRKMVGPFWFWVVVWFRSYARNVVYNYKLQNGLWLKRLYERSPEKVTGGYALVSTRSVHHLVKGKVSGFVKYRRISLIEYLFVYWFIWGWLDDDSNHDTLEIGFIRNILSGENKSPIAMALFKERLEAMVTSAKPEWFGNAFELGDHRAKHPLIIFLGTWLWVWRNTAYNFKYDQYESLSNGFYKEWFGYSFGWVAKDFVGGRQNYTLQFFGKPAIHSLSIE